MPAPRGSGAYVSIRLCVVYFSFVSSVRDFFGTRFFSTRFFWYADSRTRSYSSGAPYGATRFLRCFTASRSQPASGDRVAPQGAHKTVRVRSPCLKSFPRASARVLIKSFPCASARVLKSFFILNSSFFILNVRPLRGRLPCLSHPRVTLATLAHPRLSMVGPLRGPMSLRSYGEAFFILHS